MLRSTRPGRVSAGSSRSGWFVVYAHSFQNLVVSFYRKLFGKMEHLWWEGEGKKKGTDRQTYHDENSAFLRSYTVDGVEETRQCECVLIRASNARGRAAIMVSCLRYIRFRGLIFAFPPASLLGLLILRFLELNGSHQAGGVDIFKKQDTTLGKTVEEDDQVFFRERGF